MVRNVGIAMRIEDLVVDPVDDTMQLVGVCANELVQALAELGCLDLRRIPLAHRVDDVGKVDAPAEDVDDVVEARDANADQAPLVEAGKRQRAETEYALGGEVVDGQGGRYLGGRSLGVDAIDQVRHQGGIPVVDVDDVGGEVQRRQHLEQR